MIYFFKKSKTEYLSVGSHSHLKTEDLVKLSWLFSGAEHLENDEIPGPFSGPRKEMITPWSTNAIEITQNCNIIGIFRIETFNKDQIDFDPMLEQKYTILNQAIFSLDQKPSPILTVEDIPSFLSDANLVRAVGCYPQQSGERARSQIRTRGDQTKKVIQYLAIPVSIPSGWNGLHGQFEIHVYNIFEGIFWRKDGPNFLAEGWFERNGSNFKFLVSDANVPHHVDITCSIDHLNDMRTRDVERDEVFDPAPNTHEHVPLSKISQDNLRLGLRDDLIYNIYPAVVSDNHQLQTIDEAGWEADKECQFWIDLHRFGIDQDVLTSFPWSLWRKS